MHVTPKRLAILVPTALLVTLAPGVWAAVQTPSGAPNERSAPTAARSRPPAPSPGAQVAAVPMSPDEERDARQTREKLQELLERYPPSLGRVLRLDPTLLGDPSYLTSYPALAAFLGQHPEVVHNPTYFFEHVYMGDRWDPPDARAQTLDIWRNLAEGLAILTVMCVIIGSLMWLIRTLIDYRRWSRLAKVQSEAHTKLLDRFTSNEDLLSYMRTPAGSRFLQSAPIPLDAEPRALGAPVSRILWSFQAGVVLAALGIGLQFVSRRVEAEVTQPLSALGALVLAVGLGFVVSAAASYYLSRRLGVLTPPASSSTGQGEPANG